MNAVALALLASSLVADPAPGNTMTIDSLSFNFGDGGKDFGGGGLKVTADGEVTYSYSSAPFTGSGGRMVHKEWELTKDEVKELFAKLLADGLLEGDKPVGGFPLTGGVRVTSGRWRATASRVPDKAMARLRPLLAKAHPEMWGEKPAPEEKPAAKATNPGPLTELAYEYRPTAEGDRCYLYVTREGKVEYTRSPGGPPASGRKVIRADRTLPAKDAETLLDALAADGLLDLADAKSHRHMVYMAAGRWGASLHPKELPDAAMKHLRPLLEKADPEFWKKP